LSVSEDLTVLSAGDWVRIDGHDVRVKEVKWSAHEKCVKPEDKTFPGDAGTFATEQLQPQRDIEPAKQRNGKKIERFVLTKLRRGDMSEWDSTAFFTFFCGCSTTCCRGRCLWLTTKLLLLLGRL
jgi:hypothetical protein